MKKILSAILSFVMIISALAVPLSAMAADGGNHPTGISSFAVENGAKMPKVGIANSTTSTYKGSTYYSQGKQLYNKVKDKVCQRAYDIDIYYYSTKAVSNQTDFITDVLVNACSDELSTTAVDGDYAFWQLAGFSYETSYSKSNGKYYYLFEVEMFYNDTKSQEEQVDKVVNSFVKSVDFSKLSDYQVMKKVHDFICERADYDYDAANAMNGNVDRYSYAFSAYGALVKGQCVCQGYALAFYRLCKELGYNVRFVSSDPNEGCHAWNIVMLDGKYYFVDCTWDDEGDDYSYDYFLVDYDGIRADDNSVTLWNSSGREHTLDVNYYETSYFKNNYEKYFAQGDYDSTNSKLISNCVVSIPYSKYTYKGKAIKPQVTVKENNGTAVQAEDYSVSYSSNVATGTARVAVTGVNSHVGSARRSFDIKPTQVTGVTATTRTTDSITLKWNTPKGNIDGYRIYKYKNGSWYLAKTVSASANSAKMTSLSSAGAYRFKIRAYKKSGGKYIYGSFSKDFISCTRPKSTAIKTISSSAKSISLTWSKVKCTGYQIQYSKSKNMDNAKTVKVSGDYSSKKLTGLTKGKAYYVRIRPYKTFKGADGKTYNSYGSYSAKKSITVK